MSVYISCTTFGPCAHPQTICYFNLPLFSVVFFTRHHLRCVALFDLKAMPAAFQGQGEIILNKAKSMHESVGSARLGFMSEVQEEIKVPRTLDTPAPSRHAPNPLLVCSLSLLIACTSFLASRKIRTAVRPGPREILRIQGSSILVHFFRFLHLLVPFSRAFPKQQHGSFRRQVV